MCGLSSLQILHGSTRHRSVYRPKPVWLFLAHELRILKGLKFLHSQGVIHRDIKAPRLDYIDLGSWILWVSGHYQVFWRHPENFSKAYRVLYHNRRSHERSQRLQLGSYYFAILCHLIRSMQVASWDHYPLWPIMAPSEGANVLSTKTGIIKLLNWSFKNLSHCGLRPSPTHLVTENP